MIQSVEEFYLRRQKYRRVWLVIWILNIAISLPFAPYNTFNALCLLGAVAAFSWLMSRYVMTAEMVADMQNGRLKVRTEKLKTD